MFSARASGTNKDYGRELRRLAEAAIVRAAMEVYEAVTTDAGRGGSDEGLAVASGRLHASVTVSLSAPVKGDPGRVRNYRYPSARIHRFTPSNLPARLLKPRATATATRGIRRFKLGQSIHIASDAPYARRLEKTGHWQQSFSGRFKYSVSAAFERATGGP